MQSEVDRRAARANKERDDQGRFTRRQRVESLKDQARQARRTDVYKAAEIEDEVDGLLQQEAFVRGVVENYDRVSIDPLMAALPERDRASLMADLPDGLEGRKQLVTAALARLKQVWQAEAVRGGGAPARTPQQNGSAPPPPSRPRPARPGAGGRGGRAGGLRRWTGARSRPAGDERLAPHPVDQVARRGGPDGAPRRVP